MIFTVHCHRDNLTGFRRGFPAQRQRLMVFSGIDNIVLRDSIDRDGRCRSIHANRLTAVHGIARRVLAADVHRPGAVAQRLRIRRRHLHAPCAVCTHLSRIGFAVQRNGQLCSLRQVLAGTRKRKACGLLAGVDDVIPRRGCQRHARHGSINGHGDAACGGRFTAVDLHD